MKADNIKPLLLKLTSYSILASARRARKAQISEKYYLYFLASNIFF